MTRAEIKRIRRALELLLQRLVLKVQPPAADNLASGTCPVRCFAKRYLKCEPTEDVTSSKLWSLFADVAASGQVRVLPRAEVFRRLQAVMEALFGSVKSHNIERRGHRVRGFRGVGIRLDGIGLKSEAEAQ
jgi:hypothetical protein